MDIRALTTAIAACVQPNSPTRSSLKYHLDQLLDTTVHLKAANVEATSLLTHVTLAVVRVFSPGQQQQLLKLSDKERELGLKCLLQALILDKRKAAKQMAQVHAIIIDHLSRILVALFTQRPIGDAENKVRQASEHTRSLAIECWRALFVGTASVYVPKTHSEGQSVSGDTTSMPFTEYTKTYLPPDYLSLCVCELLDNAELSQEQDLRLLALETLNDIQLGDRDGYCPGVLNDRDNLEPMFPGVASALARIALAQAPKQQPGSSLHSTTPENWRSPSAAVRAKALHVFKTSLVVMYGHASAEQEDDLETNSSDMVADWAQRARQDVEHIINSSEEDSESVVTKISDGGNADSMDDNQRIQQVLWRLSSLRHVKASRITSALLELFTAVALDCAALQPTKCLNVAIETCLVIAGAHPEDQASMDIFSRLAEECRIKADGAVSRRLSLQMESALPLFDRYISDGTDQQREDILCLLSGYIQVLGASRSQPLLASWWKSCGLGSFLNSLKISLPGTSLLITEITETSDSLVKPQSGSVEYVLDHYRGAELDRALNRFIIQILKVFTPTEMCSQLLSLLLDNDPSVHSSALWLISRTAAQSDSANLNSAYQTFFQYCADFFGSSGDYTVRPAIADETNRTLHSCMVLNAISSIVPMVGSGVAYYLDFILFPLLQTTTADAPLLQSQAQHALDVLAQTMCLTSVADMLKENVDYIVEGCSQQMRSVELHHNVFQILTGAVRLVGEPILPYMDDVAEDTLDVCERLATVASDEQGRNDDLVTSALGFLEAVTRTVATAHGSQMQEADKLLEDNRSAGLVGMADPDPIGKVIDELDEIEGYDRMAEFIDLDSADNSNGGEPTEDMVRNDAPIDNNADDDDKDPAGSPLAIKITLVTQNFLTSEATSHQLISLKILQNTLEALQNTRDLLPLINEVWPALVHRLSKDRDAFYVTLAACDVIETVCGLGESWMRRRVRDDLWIHLQRVLKEATVESVANKPSERGLVERVLKTMRTVVFRVPLDDPIAWDLAWLSIRFIGSSILQPHVVDLLRAMGPVYGDKIWLILSKYGLISDPELTPDAVPNLGLSIGHIKAPYDISQQLGL
ncbi:hypothetical protein IW140_004234 [Coemansia sp. RSA 1813]|nr:hypothetical protein LPJ74_004010 [Coemansia sp. RSA 1843]KAJ2088087.1 hypothetical protein IW138_004507 [Coemansia sp. RSA 986]KAJ2568063.1 hypothetical protein IW140_004234 [Coemansia sp. RSA 1813]